ncbi:hypothetical protein [Martelella radicis]|uniref:Uncharacterized protein n=1 Tax=Martelella radicis TaxID=1397476 RepID=A0A7W6KMQ1_9HYPH|nr:hypothetical protein [Martelella radicis]MBB4123960.1 hypothetical protein [Martelella radicis]
MSSIKPNNFPRAGEHNTVTRAHLETLEAHRAKPQAQLAYTIGGIQETQAHSVIETERNHAIRTGHARLNAVSEQMRSDLTFASQEGRAKADFNARSSAEQSYADAQRKAAERARTRSREPER